MFGHYFQTFPWFITMFFAGNLWVAVFFFYSGYGLKASLLNKPDYLKGFVSKKLLQIYVPFLIAEGAYTIAKTVGENGIGILKQMPFEAATYINVLGLKLSNGTLWYVIELLVIYAIFYITGSLFKNKKVCEWVFIVLYVVFVLLCVFKDIGTWWYVSTVTFIFGYMYDKLNNVINKLLNNQILTAIIVAVFVILYSMQKYFSYTQASFLSFKYTYIVVALNFVLAPIFVYALIAFTQKVNVKNHNKIFVFFGNISYEIYLWHMFVFNIVKNILDNLVISVFVASVLTIIVSFLMSKVRLSLCKIRAKQKMMK